MGDYRPNVDDVLEVNVSIDQSLDAETQERLTETLKQKVGKYVGITTIEGESLSDTNIQVLVRNSNAQIRVNDIDKAVNETFSSKYSIVDVNLVASKRRIIREQQGEPFLSRTNKVLYVVVYLEDEITIQEVGGMSNIESYKTDLLKDIDRKLPIRINESNTLGYSRADSGVFTGIEFKTDRSDITLTQVKQLQDLFENYDDLDLNSENMTISSLTVI